MENLWQRGLVRTQNPDGGRGKQKKDMAWHLTGETKVSEKLKSFFRDRRGITGLETAIILIAFVVVASVFAYTVLTAGLFSARKGQEAIYGGLKKVSETMEIRGTVIGKDTSNPLDGKLDEVVFSVALSIGNEPVDMTPPTDANGDGVPDTDSAHKTIISYIDDKQYVNNLAWSKSLLGYGDTDNLLEGNEQFEITVNLAKITTGSNPLVADTTFTLEVRPSRGSVLTITRTTPGNIGSVVQLY